MQVWSLVGELRSHMSCGLAKKKKKKKKKLQNTSEIVQLLQVVLKSDTELEEWRVGGRALIEEIRRGFLRM